MSAEADIEAASAELQELLTKVILQLDSHQVSGWSDWLRRDLVRISRRQSEGLLHLKSAFGGMGSINDVYLNFESFSSSAQQELRANLARVHEITNCLLLAIMAGEPSEDRSDVKDHG